ncbi:MAG TPA: phospholipid scramblase-related protein [Nitrospiria bacterium]|nr:phospholipid scramblase-related protein [Nitrospiria bacterium]
MYQNLSTFFAGRQQLFIYQEKEWVEILVDWEVRNRYTILDAQKQKVGAIAEKAGGILDFFKRGFFRSHRPFEIGVFDPSGKMILRLTRKFFFLFSDLDVVGMLGNRIGNVRRRFGLLHRKYDLVDATGRTFATIKSPVWRLWTFPVAATLGRNQAVITKQWGGALREMFSDADTFMIDFTGGQWDDRQRAIIFAAALSIDFDFFEKNQGSRGLLDSVLPGN